MKKEILIVSIIIVALLTGCAGNNLPSTEPGMTGHVMKIDSAGRILVIDPAAQDFSATGGVDEFYNAIFFSNAPQNIKVGDKVNVWFDNVADSYPGQSEAQHVQVITPEKPGGANLDQSEALNIVLMERGAEAPDAVVKQIAFDDAKKVWVIELKEIWSEEVFIYKIDG